MRRGKLDLSHGILSRAHGTCGVLHLDMRFSLWRGGERREGERKMGKREFGIV
jgi:hypothetical protein